MSEQLGNVRHDYIRYANCWEDADVLLKGLDIQPNDRVLSIGSAGDNSFSLLLGNPELVVAVDINPVQINLVELKKSSIRALEHNEFLQFLGFEKCKSREALFEKVKIHLSEELQHYWESRYEIIDKGVIHQGKFEKYFQLFHSRILPVIHTQKRINGLFSLKSAEQQKVFHDKEWYNWRWRTLFKLFFSNYVMGKFGRDPAFLKEVKVPVSTFILNQAKSHLGSTACQQNYFLHYIMKGDFGTMLPHYARKENYNQIKANIDRLIVFTGLAEEAFQVHNDFNKFNLSNIFEYMNPDLFKTVVSNLVKNGGKGSRYVYWNLMVPRSMSEINPELEKNNLLSQQLTQEDKGFFYSNVNVDIKQ